MYCRVLACDFDGTGATNGALAPEVEVSLRAARQGGIATLLVTGRVLQDLRLALVDFSVFDAVVAENGAVVWLPHLDRTIELAPPPPEAFLGRLRAAGIPFAAGAVVIGTWEGHAAAALTLVREAGVDLQMIFNRAAVMLLPSGVNKAVGTQRALEELGRSARNMIAFGDAENDLPLFALAEVAVAARHSVPAVAAVADDHLSHPGGGGVARYIRHLLDAGATMPTPARRRVELGEAADGTLATLPANDVRVLVSGDPRSGKSWIAGLLAERLAEVGYRLCVVDPEGDHTDLAGRPGFVPLGAQLALPAPADLPAVLRSVRASPVLDLTRMSQGAKQRYVCDMVEVLARERQATGLPHWTVIDEAHYFFREDDPGCPGLLDDTGGLVLVTYRPSLLPASVHDRVSAHIITRTAVDAERYFVEGLLGARGPRDVVPADAIGALHDTRAGLLAQTAAGPRWTTFVPSTRLANHVHHGRKYAETALPPDKGFRFRHANGSDLLARNVREFADGVATVPMASLAHHLVAGDFSRWTRDVLGDPELARRLAKLERTVAIGAVPDRDEVLMQVRDRYAL